MSTIFKYKSVCFKNFFKIYEIRPLYNTAAHRRIFSAVRGGRFCLSIVSLSNVCFSLRAVISNAS